jgi:hypothetical protein
MGKQNSRPHRGILISLIQADRLRHMGAVIQPHVQLYAGGIRTVSRLGYNLNAPSMALAPSGCLLH